MRLQVNWRERSRHFPAITRNKYGRGTLTYEGTFVSDGLQREIVRDVLTRAGLTGPDQKLPDAVKVRNGRNASGKLLHYYFNFSGQQQSFAFPYANGSDLLTSQPIQRGQTVALRPWNLAIIAEQ